jgi:ferredoxin
VLLSGQAVALKEWVPVELFLWLDPLVGLSTAIAARWWSVALIGMALILGIGVIFPRAFCGYVCPLGTLIDGFDFLVGKRIGPLAAVKTSVWSNLRFYLLAGVVAAALGGVLLSGFVAAIPVLTRGLLFSAGHVQLGLARNWGMVPPLNAAIWLSLALFVAVFLLGLIGPRFWCRYICPSGALLSLPGLLRLNTRQISSDRCIECGKCVEACSFDAIQPDFGTRALNCTFCQTCGGVCPTEAISFMPVSAKAPTARPDTRLGRPLNRRVMLGSVAAGVVSAFATRSVTAAQRRPIRPPGSVAEEQFLDLCIRCEQCLKVCPGPVLQAAGLEYGFEALWTPVAVFPHAGCHQNCNLCTEVCPTGAIEPLSLARKRKTVIGIAAIDPKTCLPHRGERECQLCFDECNAAGYCAIELRPIQLATGSVPEGALSPEVIEQMGRIRAPFVKSDACVGCGLCEYRCHNVWVARQKLLTRSAVIVKLPQERDILVVKLVSV